MIPAASQKPHKMARIVEDSEHVREKLLDLAKTLVEIVTPENMRFFIDDMISIISALLMDPVPDIQMKACKLMSAFVVNFKELVFHFTLKLTRSVLLPLSSKRSAVKIAAIQALQDLLYCGTWKYTVEIFDVLVGFKDPNYVAIKEFYEPLHNLNYFASLINSSNPSVREAFIQFIGDLFTSLPDKVDVECRLLPYLMSGLFDDFDEIKVIEVDVAIHT